MHRDRIKALLLCVALVCMHLKIAYAQTDVEVYTVTGSRLPDPSSTVQTIKLTPLHRIRGVASILQSIPSLHAASPGGRAGIGEIYLRGGDPNLTLIMLDGVPLNDPSNRRGGSFDISSIDLSRIERIEVIRNPSSAIYGSKALSGVINFISAKPSGESEIDASVAYGSRDAHRLGLGGSGDVFDQLLAWSFSHSDDGRKSEESDFYVDNFSLRHEINLSPALELKSNFRVARGVARSFPEDSGGPNFAVLAERDRRDFAEYSLASELLWGDEALQHHFKLNYYQREEDFISPGVAPGLRDPMGIPPNQSDTEYSRFQATAYTQFDLSENTQWVVGGEFENERGESVEVVDFTSLSLSTEFDLDRSVYSVFAETNMSWLDRSLLLNIGTRADGPEGFSARMSPRLAMTYFVIPRQSSFTATWSKGFKLPSFFALGNSLVGSPDFRAETSETIELNFDHLSRAWNTAYQLSVYKTKYENLIDFDADTSVLVNRNRVEIKGAELSSNSNLGNSLAIRSSLSYTKTNIKNSEDELLNRPKWLASAGLQWQPMPSLTSTWDAVYVGKRPASSIPTGDLNLDAYLRHDIGLSYEYDSGLLVTLAIENLFNESYEEAIGFEGVERRLQLQLDYSLE